MTGDKILLVIGGPTASGKTSLAIKLAQQFDTEIISADSRQFYQEMNIGTAKPTPEEFKAAPHHFVGHISVQNPYSAGQFEKDALAKINELFEKKDWVILVGGSGLFIRAITEGFDDFPDIPEAIRAGLNERLETEGIESLRAALEKSDPEYYQQLDKHNPRRIIRALEIIEHTGIPISKYRRGQRQKRKFRCLYLQPHWSRESLYQRINQRVDLMFAAGLEAEAKSLHPYQTLGSLQTVGYQELFDYFEDKINLNRAKELIQQNSRRYAKRQLTWARQSGQWYLLAQPFADSALAYIKDINQKWSFTIEHHFDAAYALKSGHNEERVTKISWINHEQEGYFILAKQPKFAQALFLVNKNYPTAKRLELLQQLIMRTEGFPLYLWSNEALPEFEKFDLVLQESAGVFPFDESLINKDLSQENKQLFKYKKSK